MNPLLINSFSRTGGAARAALRLHRGLLDHGVDSRLLVQFKEVDEPGILGPQGALDRFMASLRMHLDALPARLAPNHPLNRFCAAYVPERVRATLDHLNPDLIHLHWWGAGFLRLESLQKFKWPLVWTLHDSWGFTGGCYIPFDCTRYEQQCGACPVLGSKRERDLSRRVWRRKAKAWEHLDLTIITPSRWLADCARSSSLFKNRRIEVIPNGIDAANFGPVEKGVARELLQLPQDRHLILFGAVDSTSDPNKGFHLLRPALENLKSEMAGEQLELIVYGASVPEKAVNFGLKVRYLGRMHDDISLVLLNSAADVFVAPSMQENLSNTVLEALACGTPCVAFNVGGMPDMIEHRQNGYLAQPFEAESLAQGIAWVLYDGERLGDLSVNARTKVENEFAIEKVAVRHVELYREVLG